MKPMCKNLIAACFVTLLCCLFCCTASAEGNYVFLTFYNETNANNKYYGVDIGYSIPDKGKKEVVAHILNCYDGYDVDIPSTVTYENADSGVIETYKIISISDLDRR